MNLEDFFNINDIKCWTSGKNVSQGWINIRCIFCGDKSNHLGIRKSDLKASCWKCGGHYFPSIVKEIIGCSMSEAKSMISEIDRKIKIEHGDKNKSKRAKRIILPSNASKEFPSIHLRYLKLRNFNPRKLIKEYDLLSCYLSGPFKFRIIIPIFYDHKMVAYTSRDVTDTQKQKYKMAKDKNCIVPASSLLYNFDTVEENGDAFCMEGPTDVWRFGKGAFCLLGVALTNEKLIRIAKRKINNLYVLFDNDSTGIKLAKKHARTLAPVAKKVQILKLRKHSDPAKMKDDDVMNLKTVLNFNK